MSIGTNNAADEDAGAVEKLGKFELGKTLAMMKAYCGSRDFD